MPVKISIEEIKKRLKERHKGKVHLKDESEIKNMHSTVTFVDIDYGEWQSKIYNTVNEGHGHPARGRENCKKTCLSKYGKDSTLKIENFRKDKFSISKVKEKINELFKDTLILDEKTYKNTYTKCRFIHKEHGEWWIIPKQLWIYKLKAPLGITTSTPECRKQILLSSANKTIKNHWKTGTEIVCQAGWEPKVVEYFNKNKIDFQWQIPFKMPNGKKYFVDCYLPDQNLWIEIKGYFRKDAQEKWNWFHREYPNSELWNKKVLKQKGIL